MSALKDRLARLANAFAYNNVTDSGNEELLKKIGQVELEDAKAEREKALKQAHQPSVENAKLQYRLSHLVRALQEADSRLASK